MEENNLSHISLGTGITVLALAFGAWAWVVAWGVMVVRREIEEIRKASKATAEELHKISLNREARISHLETVADLCLRKQERNHSERE